MAAPNPPTNSDTSSTRGKRRKKIVNQTQNQPETTIHWKSQLQQQIYSSKLISALHQVRLRASGEKTPPTNRVRDAAYRVLATTAKGRSRWSRAILTNRLKLKFMKKKTTMAHTGMTVITTGNSRSKKKSKVTVSRLKSKGLPAFQRKARFLGRLIPGCKKQPSQVVLEEAIDYIPALEMQVRAMTALVERLSTTNGSSQTHPN